MRSTIIVFDACYDRGLADAAPRYLNYIHYIAIFFLTRYTIGFIPIEGQRVIRRETPIQLYEEAWFWERHCCTEHPKGGAGTSAGATVGGGGGVRVPLFQAVGTTRIIACLFAAINVLYL